MTQARKVSSWTELNGSQDHPAAVLIHEICAQPGGVERERAELVIIGCRGLAPQALTSKGGALDRAYHKGVPVLLLDVEIEHKKALRRLQPVVSGGPALAMWIRRHPTRNVAASSEYSEALLSTPLSAAARLSHLRRFLEGLHRASLEPELAVTNLPPSDLISYTQTSQFNYPSTDTNNQNANVTINNVWRGFLNQDRNVPDVQYVVLENQVDFSPGTLAVQNSHHVGWLTLRGTSIVTHDATLSVEGGDPYFDLSQPSGFSPPQVAANESLTLNIGYQSPQGSGYYASWPYVYNPPPLGLNTNTDWATQNASSGDEGSIQSYMTSPLNGLAPDKDAFKKHDIPVFPPNATGTLTVSGCYVWTVTPLSGLTAPSPVVGISMSIAVNVYTGFQWMLANCNQGHEIGCVQVPAPTTNVDFATFVETVYLYYPNSYVIFTNPT